MTQTEQTVHTPAIHGYANRAFRQLAAESYDRHCADPVAAAESDLLGKCLSILARIEDMPDDPMKGVQVRLPFAMEAEIIDILTHRKGGGA